MAKDVTKEFERKAVTRGDRFATKRNGALPPKKRVIKPPEGGWKPHTYYAVWVAWFVGNPIHKSIFYTGFLQSGEGKYGGFEGEPAGYNQIWNPTGDGPRSIDKVHFLEVIAEIPSMAEEP